MKRSMLMAATFLLSASLSAATNAVSVVRPAQSNLPPAKVAKQYRPMCKATTLSGSRCKRHAVDGSPYCRQHAAIVRKREGKREDEKRK